MSLPSTLRLDHLELKNYRCFGEVSLDFHPELTVFVADNGSGKTALLDAAALALSTFVDAVSGTTKLHGFLRSDIRLALDEHGKMTPKPPTGFAARGKFDGQNVTWRRVLGGTATRARTSTAGATKAQTTAVSMRRRLEAYADGGRDDAPPLPLVALYGTGRLWDQERLTERRKQSSREPMGRISGYVDCLTPSSSFKAFVAWYESMVVAIRDTPVSGVRTPDRPENLLAAVRQATHTVLTPTGWQDIDWDMDQRLLVAEHPEHGRLPLSFLSDGVRNMVALVADVAHRCARLNPHFGTEAARLTPGVLLIDEVDMHLHPQWQQLVVGLLREAFPAMQMIITTHSPQVLSTVDMDCIRVVHHDQARGYLTTPQYQTKGVESADTMARVMNVHAVPKVDEATWLSNYRALVQAGLDRSAEATGLWDRLVGHFGEDHPVMHEVATLRHLQEFKRSNNIGSGGH